MVRCGPMPNVDSAVETYLANVPDHFRPALERLRATIRACAPEADEVISYGQPTFKLDGHLVAYAAFRKHLSFFPMSSTLVARFAEELEGYKTSTGTIQFTPENPLPDDLVRRMVELRIAENAEIAAARPQKKPKRS